MNTDSLRAWRNLFFAASMLLLFPLLARSENPETSDVRFALAIAQGVQTYEEPGLFDRASSFEMPILSPLQVLDETKDSTGETWYRVQRRDGASSGWVKESLVEIWNSRHALRPSSMNEGSVPGYCSESDITRAAAGDSEPCMKFTSVVLQHAGQRSPFPVLTFDSVETSSGGEQDFMQVLVPTLYSNIAATTGGTVEADKLQVMILIDATGSMRPHIEAAKLAMTEVVESINSQFSGVRSEFLVLAYRDTYGLAKGCEAMEVSSDTFDWVNASSAVSFLEGLESCQNGDHKEALWDALYLLENAKPSPGAARLLVLVGDHPAQTKTRGGPNNDHYTFGSQRYEVPAEQELPAVVKAIERTISDSTTFLAFLITEEIRDSADNVLSRLNFHHDHFVSHPVAKENESEAESTRRIAADVKAKMIAQLEKALQTSQTQAADIEACRNTLVTDDLGSNIDLFCGDAGDPDLAARIRTLISDPDPEMLVIRKLWVPIPHPSFDDVALLSSDEATRTSNTMHGLSTKKCSDLGPQTRVEVMKAIVPGVEVSSDGGSLLTQPDINKELHRYWKLEGIRRGKSILNFTPQQLSGLSSADCDEIKSRLADASNYIQRQLGVYDDQTFIWVNLSRLP